MLGNSTVQLISLLYGAFIFSILTKPIRPAKWKTIVRFSSIIIILTLTIISLVSFYEKEY